MKPWLININPRKVTMDAKDPDAFPPWPTYRFGGRDHPADLYLVPGIQAPNLVFSDGTIHCGIINTRKALAPGVGTLFHRSFADLDSASAVSAAAMRMGQLAIRKCMLEQLIQETVQVQYTLLQALTALQADNLDRYVSLCNDADGLTCLLAIRSSWLTGIIAIKGGPEDPLLRRHPQPTRAEKPKGRTRGHGVPTNENRRSPSP